MNKLIVKLVLVTLMALPLGFALPASAAAPNWNVTGSYVASFDGYLHDMFLTQDNLGNVTGNGGYLTGNTYTYAWTITSGTVSGNMISLTADYTLGAIGTTMHMTGTIAPNGIMSGIWDDNYNGIRNGTWSTTNGNAVLLGSLAAEDFGVVNYDTGLGMIKGYTAGFGLTDATFDLATSIVVKLYSAGNVLLQTNTGTAKIGTLTGANQISSPFDVSGTFDYATDGYWTNVREAQFGQSVPATKVVATVTLANGKVVTAENTILSGDPTTIFAVVPPVLNRPTTKDQCKNGGWKSFANPSFKNQGKCVSYVENHKISERNHFGYTFNDKLHREYVKDMFRRSCDKNDR